MAYCQRCEGYCDGFTSDTAYVVIDGKRYCITVREDVVGYSLPEKENILEMLCAAINDCESNNMTHTSQTLRAVLEDLEKIFELESSDSDEQSEEKKCQNK